MLGGQSRVTADGYVEGAPELVAEVSASSVSFDSNDKLEVYGRHGVKEYIVWLVLDRAVDWFFLHYETAFLCRYLFPMEESSRVKFSPASGLILSCCSKET